MSRARRGVTRSLGPLAAAALALGLALGCTSIAPGRGPEESDATRAARVERENIELRRELTMKRMNEERRRQRVADGDLTPSGESRTEIARREADRRETERLEATARGELPRSTEPGAPIDDGIDAGPLVSGAGVVEEEIDAPVVAPPAPPPDATVAADPRPVDPRPAESRPAESTPTRSTSPGATTPTVEAPAGDAQALYDQGYALYHQKDYAAAETTFRRFLDAHPTSELADNALFWVGECRYARGDYVTALEAFGGVVDRYPSGNKVPDAMLKAGACLEKLDRRADAIETYTELLRLFSSSAASITAEERLEALR